MKKVIAVAVLSMTIAGISHSVLADEAQSEKPAHATHETVELKDVLDVVARKSGKEFLVDRRAPAEVVLGTIKPRDVDYAILLTVLRNNGLAAAPSDEAVRIVPVGFVRQYKLPLVRENDDAIPSDEWVTRILAVEHTNAVRLVPILRPMIQQAGHLVADSESNKLIIVAPHGVTEHLAEIVDEVDTPAD